MIFRRYIGIDYSGARTPEASLKGLRVYMADGDQAPTEVPPPPSLRKYWSRKGIAEWLVNVIVEDVPTIVGIDHAFSFPLKYFQKYKLPPNWPAFLDDFCRHWPTDEDYTYVDFVRDGASGNGAARTGNRRWRRTTEELVGAKSVFHFDVQGQVAKSTHAGLPWLRFVRERVGGRVHFWPFDGWDVPHATSVIAEVYPRLWNRSSPIGERTQDQHDAYSIALWLQRADLANKLEDALSPNLSPEYREAATVEGWILGSDGYSRPARSASKARNRSEVASPKGTVLAFAATMPEISRFLGIVIGMFYSEHGPPHFHARYGEHRASVEIETGRVVGHLPPRVVGLVLEWRALHVAELLENWGHARDRHPLRPVPPLE